MTFSRRSFLGSSAAAAAGMAASSGTVLTAGEKAAAEERIDYSKLGKTPHTKFAVNLEMWWTKLPFMDRIRKAAELGFPAFEFWPYQNKDIDGVAKLSKELGLEISQF